MALNVTLEYPCDCKRVIWHSFSDPRHMSQSPDRLNFLIVSPETNLDDNVCTFKPTLTVGSLCTLSVAVLYKSQDVKHPSLVGV